MELFDLYDADRMPLHRTAVRGGGIPENCYHIVIHICIFNSRGEMLIQKRQKNKANWPDLWDFSVGGTVSAGERSGSGAERELHEELGIDLPLRDMRPSLTVHYDTGFDDLEVLTPDLLTMIDKEKEGEARYHNYTQIMGREAALWYMDKSKLPPLNEITIWKERFRGDKNRYATNAQIIIDIYKRLKTI